jgi:hypothetical protein
MRQDPENRMVDDEANRQDRKEAFALPGKSVPSEKQLPNRRTRRLIAKRRGVFKHKGLWPHVNNRASNTTRKELNNDDQA